MAMPFMALVGATWAFLFIGGNFHLMENNPRSTSTGIFSSTLSIATVIGPIIAGTIAFTFNYISVMYFAIVIIVIAFIVSLKIKN
jgi:DHA1 family multidrug resistance protein-like MFS transporter